MYAAPWRGGEGAASAGASYRPRGGLGSGDGALAPGAAEESLRRLQQGMGGGMGGGGVDFEGVRHQGSGGAGGGHRSSGAPVQFERAQAGTAGASAAAADPFGVDAFVHAEGSGRPNALAAIGSRGFMAAVGGGAARSAEELGQGSGRSRVDFTRARS